MVYPQIPLAQSIILLSKQKNIRHIVISPGSRNAPLTIGFTADNYFTCYSIVDERCAAFFALGIAQQTKQPVIVVCTSGSALLNYYPAVAEAFYAHIPLIVISADRPKHKIDIGDGQTIRQENVFANHSLYNANLTEQAGIENDAHFCKAIDTAIANKGPVHINVPFEEPLYNIVNSPSVEIYSNTYINDRITDKFDIFPFVETWNKTSKKLIIFGENSPNTINANILEKLSKDPSVVVLSEKNSNIHHKAIFDKIDQLITPFTDEDFEHFRPELLITIGGMLVSKRIKTYLRKYTPKQHWHINPLCAYDTFGCLTHHIKVEANTFFKLLFNQKTISVDSNYQNAINQLNTLRIQKHNKFIETAPYSDLTVFGKICELLPQNIHLQISNSSPIRYVQLFDLHPSIEIFCNRGTSGIDGSTSTAIGASIFNPKPTILITGDISFFYDSNALWNNYIPTNFKIIIINNSGGGIFRILPGHQKNETFSTYFETQHNLEAGYLAQMYHFDYHIIDQYSCLEDALKNFFSTTTKTILEIKTPTEVNDLVLKNYFEYL
ncbi:MAG: 2-succinyl-5-enolpyruvyl-6-hydroxy-3-cyclohexene-1-carboxylic-acid synthase [Bacteroidota bacterium]|nr:2-succinyl-5-enolpyruvyl-6-hydroxy-3-cyclohexene-1-carboxylic-acid synthase [Bacteroidota bacterium]